MSAERAPSRAHAMNHRQVQRDRAPRPRLLQPAVAAAKIERILDLMPLDAHFARARPRLRAGGARASHHRAFRLDRGRDRPLAVHARCRARAGRVDRRARPAAPRRPDIRDFRADPETFHLTRDARRGRHRRRHGRHLPARCAPGRSAGGYVLRRRGLLEAEAVGRLVAVLGGDAGQLLDHRGNVQAGIDAGLVPMHAVTRATTSGTSTSGNTRARSSATRASSRTTPTCRRCSSASRRWRDAYLVGPRSAGLRGLRLLPAWREGRLGVLVSPLAKSRQHQSSRSPRRARATRPRAARAGCRHRPAARSSP